MVFHDSLDHQDLTPLALPAQIKKYKILYCNKIQSFSIEMHKQTNKHGVPSAVCFMRKKRVMMMSYALDRLQLVSLCFSAQEEHSALE
jgi:histidinol phosphatase-like enzyme